MKKFNLVDNVSGYVNKRDITNITPEHLVSPSKNVLINDGEKIAIRGGYTIYGAANTALTPILSSHEWNTSTGTELDIRHYGTVLEVYYSSAWQTLKSGLTAGLTLNFAEWWSSAEAQDLLLFADGTSNMNMWSGGATTYASATANTITKQGTTTWAEDRFLTTGTKQVNIDGITYTYTGGESTTTLTGVTPDPTSGGHTAGDVVLQTIRVTANTPASGVTTDIIAVLNNNVYVASTERRDVYVSSNTDYTSYTVASPRVPGGTALLTLDSPPIGFAVGEKDMYISGSKSEWYQTALTLSADLTAESLTVNRLKTSPGQGALSQSAIGNAKNYVIYVSNENVIDFLGRVENIDTPQSRPLSDPIKSEVADYDVTIKPHVKYHKNKTYIAFPSESRVLIYDHEKRFWQPPQVLPVRRFAIIGGDLYGHSNSVPETYKLFDGTSDNTNPIHAIAAFAYRNYDHRAWKKQVNEWYTEGYISSNTTLTFGLKYDFGGFTSIIENDISGADTGLLFSTVSDGSLGKTPFGQNPLGSVTDSASDLPKFRVVHEITKTNLDFYEIQPYYESNDVDYQWELLAQGGNVTLSTNDNISIKR